MVSSSEAGAVCRNCIFTEAVVTVTVMVVVKAVALSQAWKPIKEFRRLWLSWEGYVTAKQAKDHPWKSGSWRFKVSQAQGNKLHPQTCSLSAKVLQVGGCTKPPTGIFLLC